MTSHAAIRTPAFGRVSAVQRRLRAWLSALMNRLMVARMHLVEANALAFYRAERRSPVEHLTALPPIGTLVRLIEHSSYLRDYHGAVIGSVGTVVDHSRLNPEDNDGVLVEWGAGFSVRCSLEELGMAQGSNDQDAD